MLWIRRLWPSPWSTFIAYSPTKVLLRKRVIQLPIKKIIYYEITIVLKAKNRVPTHWLHCWRCDPYNPVPGLKKFDHFYIWADRRTSDIGYFLQSWTTSSMHAAVTWYTSLICPRIRMVIQLISSSVLTSPPYFTNYDSTYLQHFAIKMYEYRSGPELKLAIWRQIRKHAKKYFER